MSEDRQESPEPAEPREPHPEADGDAPPPETAESARESEESAPEPGPPFPESRKRGTLTGPPPARGGRRGRATRPVDPENPCLNCGDPTPGEYCPTCGQRKVDVQVSVRVMLMDVLEDQFILDRRLPRTLSHLFLRPGRLTVEYVNGRMASYIHPFRLYLVSSVLFFLLLSFLSLQLVRRATIDNRDEGAASDVAALAADSARLTADSARLAELDQQLGEIDAQLADTTLPASATAGLQAGRLAILRNRDRLEARLDSVAAYSARTPAAEGAAAGGATAAEGGDAEPRTAPAAPAAPGDTAGTGGAQAAGDTAAASDADPGAGPRGPPEEGTVAEMFDWGEGDGPTINFGIAAVDSAVAGRIRQIGRMEPREALEELVGTFVNYVPTLMFILLPIFAGVLKLLYIRRRRFYAEHFVFLLHVHSFVYLLATVMLLIRRYVPGWVELALFAWVAVYIFIALKRVYGQGWFRTFAKYWILGWTYFWVLTASLPFAVVATLLLF